MNELELLKDTAKIRNAVFEAHKAAYHSHIFSAVDGLYNVMLMMTFLRQKIDALNDVWVYQSRHGMKLSSIESITNG